MNRYSFATFLRDDANREAAALCERVAGLEPVAPMPVLLLGEDGSGKTHLLYAIVNRIRVSSPNACYALVAAHDFPDQVRALIDRPDDVARAQNAVLLVDQLEGFGDLAIELEAIVRLFLDNGHAVVLASSVHPERLPDLSPTFVATLAAGQAVQITGRDAKLQLELLEHQVRQQAEEELERCRGRIRELETAVEATRQDDAAPTAEQTALLKEIDALREQLGQAQKEEARARKEAGELLQRVDGLLGQLESSRTRLVETGAVKRAARPEELRGEWRDLEAELRGEIEHAKA